MEHMRRKCVFLPYDFDTAIGTNNVGTLAFGYSLEDIDTINGEEVFNGQDSVLWTNLREMFADELKAMYRTLRSSGALSYAKVEQLFEDHQNKWPESIFNEDAEAKYIAPLIEEDDETYLPMLQGSKTEQRKWWLYNRFRYLDSKYNSGDALSDYIDLRANAPADINVTPYADIYATVKFASYLVQQRAMRNIETTLACPLQTLSSVECQIFSASQLSSVGDLSGLKTGRAVFTSAVRLTSLKLGDSDQSYDNPNLGMLSLGNNTLLKTLDVRNCSGLGDTSITGHTQRTVDLTGCTGIEEVYFDGTKIAGVDLPNGGVLKKLHLPGTIATLTIRNQPALTEFVCPDYSNITSLWLENPSSAINPRTIIAAMAAGSRVRLFGFEWTINDPADIVSFCDTLDDLRGLDQNGSGVNKAQVYGTIHTGTITGAQLASINSRYPDITVDYAHVSSNVYYRSWDGETLLATKAYVDGVGELYTAEPSRTSTAQYSYAFAGWSLSQDAQEADEHALDNITGDRTVYAAYTRTVRTYTVTFVRAAIDGGGTLYTQQNVAYGATPVYGGSTPTSGNTDGGVYEFSGWTPAIGPITGATTYTATFNDIGVTVTYMVGETQYATEKLGNGGNAQGPSTNPTKASTAQYNYTFAGWSTNPSATAADANALNNVTADRTLYAVFTETVRTYTITFVGDGGTTLETKQVAYGTVPTYTGATPTKTGDWQFTGWNPALAAVTGAATYTAVFVEQVSPVIAYLKRTMTEYESDTATAVGDGAFYQMTSLISAEMTATAIGSSAFYACSNLETVDLTASSGVVAINGNAFSGCAKLMSIFIRSSSLATISSAGLPIQFTNGKGAIYVPTALVDTYKAANNWSTYATHIFAISEYPVTNFDTIKDDLSTFCSKLANGTANYNVGDVKTIDLGTEGEIRFQVAGKGVDELTSGGSYAAYTFIAMDLLATDHRMNPALNGTTEGTGTIGGWGKSEMRTYLTDTIWAKIPAELQAVIKQVKKYSCIYDTSGTKVANDETSDKLWIPSVHEVFNNTTYETQGPVYSGIFSNNNSRTRMKPDASSAGDWWERSARSTSTFRYVNTSGNDYYYDASYACCVLLGFCA